ncbi:MAG: hypothetical protein INR69_08270 [Mucilaginibacter polytrichastri]|nr:hypothetical protein [Mucilaginibacter polytrichastri]
MRRWILLCFVFLAALTGCELDPPIYPHLENVVAVDTTTYQPIVENGEWTYELTTEKDKHDELHKQTGVKETIGGNVFEQVQIEPPMIDKGLIYYSYTKPYYIFRTQSPLNSEYIELPYMKDEPVIGASWIGAIGPSKTFDGKPSQTRTTIRETDEIVDVLGRRYNHVVHTMVEIMSDLGDGKGMTTIALYHFYTARGIGIIRTTADYYNNTYYLLELKKFSPNIGHLSNTFGQ